MHDGLIGLLTPPFDKTTPDPGYVKGYVPGVRENGGQYTRAALWVVKALAESGRPERATRLLEMLNPIHRARTPAQVAVYQVEPYAVAADEWVEVHTNPERAGELGRHLPSCSCRSLHLAHV
jgi:N,N'-diacetylchitobiose phosphorylase